MDEIGFKKDSTPYLVFACTKCHQFSYVKTTQKTKRCLRCRRIHQVTNLSKSGEVVVGITTALNRVKEKQNQLGYPELKTEYEFSIRGDNEPNIATNRKRNVEQEEEDNYDNAFKSLLKEIGVIYSQFPAYLIRTLAIDYQIPVNLIPILTRKFVKNKTISQLENGYYQVV
jgi:hypothetical protein